MVGDYEDVEVELGLKTQRQNPAKPNELTELFADLRASATAGQQPDSIMDAASGPDRPQPYISPGKTGRNEPCPCGSGRKYKKCCGK